MTSFHCSQVYFRRVISSGLETANWKLNSENMAYEGAIRGLIHSILQKQLCKCATLHHLGVKTSSPWPSVVFFEIIVEQVQYSLLKVADMDYIECIPKNVRHDFDSWQTQLGLLQHRFASKSPLVRLLLYLRYVLMTKQCSNYPGLRLNIAKHFFEVVIRLRLCSLVSKRGTQLASCFLKPSNHS